MTEREKAVSVGVMGVGRMGSHHARVLGRVPGAKLDGVYDAKYWRAKAAAWRWKGRAFRTPAELLDGVQAVIIAVPTPFHFELGREALSRGIHCLIEKPLASNVEEARALLDISQKTGAVLQVGHIERFNPAVLAAVGHIRSPRFVTVERLGPYDPRTNHIGVVLDLMIHDIDILLTLMESEVESLEALGAHLLSDHEDIANLRLRFKNGAVADLTASRISLEKCRKLRIFQEDSYISIDYLNTALKIYRKKRPIVKSLLDIENVRTKLSTIDPLEAEHRHFIDCIRHAKKPWPSGERGLEALRLALRITDEIRRYHLTHAAQPPAAG